LEREFVELEGGDEADDSFGDKNGSFDKGMRCVNGSIRELVQSACGTNDLLVTDKARQGLRVDVLGEEILLAKHSTGLQEVESTSFLG
jgi:hypothetical protein